MRRSSWNYYGVKLIYQMTVTGSPIPERVDENYSDTHTFFEESIVLVRAQSFNHAYKLAEKKAREIEETHINPYGQSVETKLVDAIDCYFVGDEISSGVEIYSSFTPVKKEIAPSEYLMSKYNYNLKDHAWNEEKDKKQVALQTVLRYEEFSKWRKK